MTHSPLPFTADGCYIRDARNNPIGQFNDWRDGQAFNSFIEDLRKEIANLQEELKEADRELRRLEAALKN